MGAWDTYESRVSSIGGTKRNTAHSREQRNILNKLTDNLSYELVDIFDSEHSFNVGSEESLKGKVEQNVAVINSDNLNEKYIYSMPGEDIELGSLVYMYDSYWLVHERDHKNVLYTRSKMIQCNHLLKWVQDGEIMTQWCVIEDGTKLIRTSPVRNSLVHWKRCAISIP